ncbi:Protein of unknown function (Ytp1) domain containing protein [Naviculisporaceae sp. PSN 640]
MKSLARPLSRALAVGVAAGVGLASSVMAHGDDDMNMDGMKMGEADKPLPEDQYPPTYFALADHRVAIYSHIGLMVLAWVFILPVAVMLSLARSRYRLTAQFVFLAVNGGGLLLGTIYNASTPDLYPNNAHHTLGWVVTWLVCSQVAIGLLSSVAGVLKRGFWEPAHGRADEHQYFIPVSTEAIAEHESSFPKPHRFSDDSGQGTEPNTESLASAHSQADPESPTFPPTHAYDAEYHEVDDDNGLPKEPKSPSAARKLLEKIASKISSRVWNVLMFGYNVVDRTSLVLGFVALATGIITFGRFFEGDGIFSGLAHWIKGGIFFWLGIITLGRWAGSFGELGWAWNVRPRQRGQKWRPSAEFVESALIFTYGSTNIFLEHLGNWGGEYSAQDLEHISITVLFIGGGLCGMLIESTRIRDLLNTTVEEAGHINIEKAYHDAESRDETHEPETYAFSMNPIPALVILLLGIMMSSHTQQSMISSMVHKQWGNLLTGASFARGLTYVLTYLKPPRSIYPSRPPTELLTAFGLIAGGIIFMASSSDTVDGMIHYELDAMFMYTVTMGLVGLLMAWVILVVAIKGWAVRREARAAYAKA